MKLYYPRSGIQMLRVGGPIFAMRALKHVILKRLGALQLISIFICPSHQCNANCVHCYEKFANKMNESLTTAEIKDALDQFARLGGLLVHFCSGELLLREDCCEIVEHATRRHIYTSITTNGILLDQQTIGKLKAAGLKEVVVSIDSANPARHDELRGVRGCFDRAVNGLRLAKANGLNTVIWTYVSKSNFDELDAIARLGKELGVFYTYVFFPLLSGHYFNRPEENLTFEEREAFRAKFNHRPEVRLEFPKETDECTGGGKYHVCVMPSGDVTFCPPVAYSYGNIREKTLKECARACLDDHKRFCVNGACTGQCIINFPEYRKGANGKFMHD